MSSPNFDFEIDGNKVTLEVSHFGRESLYINDEFIETSLRFVTAADYKFTVNHVEYLIILKVRNAFTGKLECNLYQSDRLVVSKITQVKLGNGNKLLSVILLLVLCGAVGFIVPQMGNWIWLSPILFILAVVLSLSCRERIYEIETKTKQALLSPLQGWDGLSAASRLQARPKAGRYA